LEKEAIAGYERDQQGLLGLSMINNEKPQEKQPASNERGWDKMNRIPERASLVGDEPRRPKSQMKNETMTRMKVGPGSGGVALFKESVQPGHELLQTKGLQQGSLSPSQSTLASGPR
jgi:hypothetical protein